MTPSVYDHLRPAAGTAPETVDGGPVSDGVYRVVGVDTDTCTLLRVGDADGRRRNTGTVVTVDRGALGAFEAAENPDGNRSLAGSAGSAASSAVWSVRAFLGRLAANPLPSAVAIVLLLVGRVGGDALGIPESAQTVVVVLGAVGLALVASGRL